MVSPSAQRRALEGADAGTMPLTRRLRLLSKRGVTCTRCHRTVPDVIRSGVVPIPLASSSVGVRRGRLWVGHRRRPPSAWTATASPACAPLGGAPIGRLRARRLSPGKMTNQRGHGQVLAHGDCGQDVGPWYPVISAKRVPLRAGGDNSPRIFVDVQVDLQ